MLKHANRPHLFIRLIITVLFICATVIPSLASSEGNSFSPAEALSLLKAGNERFASGTPVHPHAAKDRLEETSSKGQHPYATVLGCSDSRVPLELLFDAGIGDIFVIRVAGNITDTDEAGSIEYGVDHLGTPVLLVLGHSKCGAVTAVTKGDEVHGNIPRLVDNIIPAVKKAREKLGDTFSPELVEAAIVNNVWQSIEDIFSRSHAVAERAREGKVLVLGGIYHLDSGRVEWLGEHPQQAALIKGSSFPVFPPLAPSMLFPVGIVLGLLALTMALLVSRKRIIKAGIKIRVYASLLSIVVVSALTSIFTLKVSSVYSSQTFSASIIIMYILVPAVIASVFSFIFAGSILASFRTVIGALKKGTVKPDHE